MSGRVMEDAGPRQSSFAGLFARHAAERPAAWCLHDRDRSYRYDELDAQAQRVAALLARHGARRGDRLALWLPNGAAWLAIFLACARLGVTVLALNTRFRGGEVGELLARTRCRWLALWPDFRGIAFGDILRDVPADALAPLAGVLVYGEPPAPQTLPAGLPILRYDEDPAIEAPPAEGRGEDIALLYTTSGTTAAPKLVMHDQHGLLAHGAMVAGAAGIGEGDAVLLGAPLCGAFGFSAALAALAAGVPLISSATLAADEMAALAHRHRATHTFANNELIDRLLAAAGRSGADLSSLRLVGFASFAPALDDLIERAAAAGITMTGLYGSSELQALAAMQPAGAAQAQRRQAGGRLVAPQARVRVRDLDSGELLPPGQAGELEIRAPSVMRGYLDDAEATARALSRDGWFRTGDLGHALDERSFVFLSRRGDALRLNGFLVNPAEIEQHIAAVEGVAACQVVGVAHEGQQVAVAFVIPAEGVAAPDAQALLAHCARHLARYKTPRKIVFLSAFPVVESANSNKIQRGRLQEMAREALGARAAEKSPTSLPVKGNGHA